MEQVKKYNDELKNLESKLHKAETEFKQKNKWLAENTKILILFMELQKILKSLKKKKNSFW